MSKMSGREVVDEEGVGEVDEVPFKAGGGRIETMFWAAAAFQLHWETEKLRRS